MKINCLWHTTNYRGDHSAEVAIAVEPFTTETVGQFCERILGADKGVSGDYMEIRVVIESKP